MTRVTGVVTRAAAAFLIIALAALGADTVRAQDEDVADDVTIVIDSEGNVTVDGEPVEEGFEMELKNGVSVVTDDDGTVVIRSDDGDTRVVRRFRGRKGGPAGFFFDDDEFARSFAFRHPEMPEFHERVMSRVMPFHGDFDVSFMDPEIMRLERESREVAGKLRRADADERDELDSRLDELLDEIFRKKLERRRSHLEELEEKVAEERAELEERQRNAEDIKLRRKAELLGEDHLDW